MGSDKIELSGLVGAVSKQAGAVVGTSVVVSKKIAGSGVRGAAAVKDMVARPVRKSASKKSSPVANEKTRPKSKASTLKSKAFYP